jgi:presenilin 1
MFLLHCPQTFNPLKPFSSAAIAAQLIAACALPVDAVTFWILLWNFAAGGVASLFLCRAPLAARQAYLVATGVVVAFMFTHVPEWTTWALLGAMAAYDLYAVLAPGGPLRALVETAEARGEDIPALIYEGRSRRPQAPPPRAMGSVRRGGGGVPLGVTFSRALMAGGGGAAPPADRAPLLGGSRASDDSGEAAGTATPTQAGPATQPPAPDGGGSDGGSDDRSGAFALPDAIKLGLGDFIFYSVLVGRASMYDLLAAAAAALAVLAGLGATLLLLALRGHALPALPISVALGAVFTAAARGVVEPVVVPLVAGLVYF